MLICDFYLLFFYFFALVFVLQKMDHGPGIILQMDFVEDGESTFAASYPLLPHEECIPKTVAICAMHNDCLFDLLHFRESGQPFPLSQNPVLSQPRQKVLDFDQFAPQYFLMLIMSDPRIKENG